MEAEGEAGSRGFELGRGAFVPGKGLAKGLRDWKWLF